jgi:hypothetical protein
MVASSTTTPRILSLTNGVQLRLSCPYTSTQNGRAEHMIRTTTNMIHWLLFQASLPASYWAEALHTATHINLLPSKAVSHPTPYFAPYGTTPLTTTFTCSVVPAILTLPPPLFISYILAPLATSSLATLLTTRGITVLTSPRLAPHHLSSCRLRRRYVPLAGSSPPTDLDSLLESDPVTPPPHASCHASLPTPRVASTPPLAPRVAPSTLPATRAALSSLSAPRAASSTTPTPRAALLTPPAPCTAPSTSAARFVDPALVYHCRGRATPSAPIDLGSSTSAARFAEPTVVYHHHEPTMPAAPLMSRQPIPSRLCTTRSPFTATPGTSTRW